jgi:hypothetical protein
METRLSLDECKQHKADLLQPGYILSSRPASPACAWSVLFRVGMAREDGEGAVELLGEHGAGEFVRERQGRKRKLLRGAAAQRFGETIRAAA